MTNAFRLLDEWLDRAQDEEVLAELEAMRAAEDESAVADAFFQDLEFGTAGLRGIIGAGTNRMNVYTVGRATQGFADYLVANFAAPSVAIARDSRNKGELFVRVAAEVLAANGITVHVYPRVEPTPALSWAVRCLGCSGGICMTASHNPAAYNGYKVYGPDGCQITTEAAKAISNAIQSVDAFLDVRRMDFDAAIEAGLVKWIDDAVLDEYIDAVAAESLEPASAGLNRRCDGEGAAELGDPEAAAGEAAVANGTCTGLKLVYTPLNGSGLECVGRILDRVGVTDVTLVSEQVSPDGDFPTCPYPNPEERAALQKGLELCESVRPDLLLATDPDADRVGIAVADGDGYALLSGNEVGILLLDYVARKRVARGEDLSRAMAVTTIVSSAMTDAIASEYGFELRRVLTGFKYIGELIGELEAEGEAERFIFGFEESYGYLSGSHVRDKDAVNASMLICQMALDWKSRGFNLAEAMRFLYEKHGFYRNRTISLSYPGAEGAARMADIMAGLRASAPAELDGYVVERALDYAGGVDGLPPANVIQFDLVGGDKLIVRPSGTEPKIELYLFARGETDAEAAVKLDAFEAAGRSLLA